MKKIAIAMIALTMAAPATAGTTLWQNIEADMTTEQVRALYPAGGKVKHFDDFTEINDFEPVEGCSSEVNIHHKAGVVDEVIVNGAGALGGKCANKLYTALLGKYGQPADSEEKEDGMFSGGFFAKEGKVAVWSKDGVTMRFQRFRNQGLLKASWKMSYSTAPANVGL